VHAGDEVLAGCINGQGLLTVRVTKEYDDSTLAKVLELVEEASDNRAETENFIHKFARYYTPAVVIAALLLAIGLPLFTDRSIGDSIRTACVFLVTSCPCALVISVPLSFFGGIGGASKKGILVKGANYLEALANTETVVLDKTGTLTEGVFEVTDYLPAEGTGKEELLENAAYAERASGHPIAQSIRKAYGKSIPSSGSEELREIAGKLYGHILEDYDNMHISTIDTFLMQLLSGLGQMLDNATAGTQVQLDVEEVIHPTEQIFSDEMDVSSIGPRGY
jgi:Cd2+/Zn2+-exporting ATPase